MKLADPNKYTTKNADCVSCHMAKQAAPQAVDPNGFKSYTFRLEHSHDGIGPFRMFGYAEGGRAVLTGRVANETAVVLEYLNKNVLR